MKDKKLEKKTKSLPINKNQSIETTLMEQMDEESVQTMQDLIEDCGRKILQEAGEIRQNLTLQEITFINNIYTYKQIRLSYIKAFNIDVNNTPFTLQQLDEQARTVRQRKYVMEYGRILGTELGRLIERQTLWTFNDSLNALKVLRDTALEAIEAEPDKRRKLTMTLVNAITNAVKEANVMLGYTDKSVKINNSVTFVGSIDELED